MTSEQKQSIHVLRAQGVTMPRIAADLAISVHTVKAFLQREQKNKEYCKHCHKPLVQTPGHRPKTFCDPTCRQAWWTAHGHMRQHNLLYHYTCAHCGQAFDSPGKQRKYCSHPCYIAGRYGEGVSA